MATKFGQVELVNIEQGQFMKDAEQAFQDVTQQLIAHQKKYGKDAVCKLTLGVKITGSNGAFVITTDITKTLPKKPAVMTTALAQANQLGEMCLFAQQGGTHAGAPNQMVFAKDNGEDLE